ncbi:hypothetical protein OESDEN_24964 [Oesophagostomum dentatum]|uniref:Uncharacterized protein n=1 Tax=Oesophagostomum dentatum TaxID=61180 RepID=A0A0B1RWJ0_OESDE|nr:hypothetical protein OESDEN_24964 [Oesophagostomum dentatum]
MSSTTTEEEKPPPLLPTFPSTYSTVSSCSTLARGVVNLQIGANSRGRTLLSPIHNEVSSSSDILGKQEHELASMWAETHDFGIDGDEFLEVEDEPRNSSNNNETETEVVDLTSEKTSGKKACRLVHSFHRYLYLYGCTAVVSYNAKITDKSSKKSHHSGSRDRSGSTHRKKHKSSSKHSSKEPADTTSSKQSRHTHRKRSSSSRSPHGSSHSDTRNKRFASEKSREKPTPRFGYAPSSATICLASDAPRAKGLPRYYPDDRHYDFTRWLDAKGGLLIVTVLRKNPILSFYKRFNER